MWSALCLVAPCISTSAECSDKLLFLVSSTINGSVVNVTVECFDEEISVLLTAVRIKSNVFGFWLIMLVVENVSRLGGSSL